MPEGRTRTPTDENDLLPRVRCLDEAALGTVFDTYFEPLYRYIYHHIGHAATAEDLTAEVFQRLLEEIRKGRGPSRHLQAWLYRVAHNVLVDELRQRKRHEHDPLDEDIRSDEPAVSAQVQEAFKQQQIRQALRKLTDKQQAVLTLKFLQELGTDEIARILKMNAATVRSLQVRGLRALRRELDKTGSFDEEKE